MAQAALCDITPQTRIPTLLIVFCVHVLLLVGRCEFRPNLERLGRSRHHWAWARTFFAVACAAVFALRVGDVGSFTWDAIATLRFLTFWDQKVNAEWVTVPFSPYLEKWRVYIHRYKRPDH